MARRILIIEDERPIADTLLYALRTEGFEPVWCGTGGDGLRALSDGDWELVILDVGLPDGSGFDFCRTIRGRSTVPIIFLTARNQEVDRIVGLELGADDYVTKPFSPREVAARVRAILRRSGSNTGNSQVGRETRGAEAVAEAVVPSTTGLTGVSVDDDACEIRYDGKVLELTRCEYRLLRALAARPGRIFSRDQLLELAWDEPSASLDRTVDAHVKTLRAKLREVSPGSDPIQTHRGFGYSLKKE